MRVPNEQRGEVALSVGGQDLIICATMDGLARVSSIIKSDTLQDLFTKISGGEPNACLAVLASWVVEGDVIAAREAMKMPELMDIGSAANQAMLAHMDDEDDDAGKPDAEAESG